MIRQQFVVVESQWKCAGCGAAFLAEGVVEHPASCPQMQAVLCKHDLLLESCAECMPKGPRSAQSDSAQQWSDLAYMADRSDVPSFGPWIDATYHGVCPCGNKIAPGDRIRADDEQGEFVCETCGSR